MVTFDLLLVAEDLSTFIRPPWWRLLARHEWRRRYQPFDIARDMLAAVHGEWEPIQRHGISTLPPLAGQAAADELARQVFTIKSAGWVNR